MRPVELNTTISNLSDLRGSDLSSYDAVYLGNIFCRLYERNFLEHPDELREGISIARRAGLKVYVTTYAGPRNSFFPKMRETLRVASENGVDAVEVLNLGSCGWRTRSIRRSRSTSGGSRTSIPTRGQRS